MSNIIWKLEIRKTDIAKRAEFPEAIYEYWYWFLINNTTANSDYAEDVLL